MAKQLGKIEVGVGGLIVNHADEFLLLLRRNAPEAEYWSIPGGSVDFGETLEAALKREIQEELGVEVEVGRLLGVADHILINDDRHFVSPQFLVKIVAGTPRNREPESHLEMRWFPICDAPAKMTGPSRLAVEKYLALAQSLTDGDRKSQLRH